MTASLLEEQFPPELRERVEGTRADGVAHALSRAFARHWPRPALSFAEREWTYGELWNASAALAERLRADYAAGDRIAFMGRNSDWYVIGWLATQIAGLVHVPVNFMLGPSEVAYIVGHSQAQGVYLDDEFAKVEEQAELDTKVRWGRLDAPEDGSTERLPALASVAQGARGVPADPRQYDAFPVAQIAYTSGTESSPKGAVLDSVGLHAQYVSCIVEGRYEQDDVVVHALPLYHCAQLHCFLIPYLLLGARNHVLAGADPAELLSTVADRQATSFFAPPTVWIGLLRHRDFAAERLASLRKGYYGASIMPVEIVRELSEVCPDLSLWNYYGQTELGPLATVLHPHEQLTKPGSAGRPVLNVDTRVVDEDLNDVAPDEVGEIVHRSPQVTRGYFRDPERTSEAFAGGWFHSGDLATVDEDGYITIVDRKKDMINTGGENVSSREVEEALYQHPAVAEVAVVGLPDAKWIEAVAAVVVLREGHDLQPDDVATFLSGQGLARFKQPRRVIAVDELPKNPSGKILKRELRTRFSDVSAP